mmetsp:Transcript_8580/g.13907  ORF Transcript_8580/g.13907 Transcript_8580/m.13907 type:complete len:686 (+) Transcript_8580:362-2419(+)
MEDVKSSSNGREKGKVQKEGLAITSLTPSPKNRSEIHGRKRHATRPERVRKRPLRYAQSPDADDISSPSQLVGGQKKRTRTKGGKVSGGKTAGQLKGKPSGHHNRRQSAGSGELSENRRKGRPKRKPKDGGRGKRAVANPYTHGHKQSNSGTLKMAPPKLLQASQKSLEIYCPVPKIEGVEKYSKVEIQQYSLNPKLPNQRTEWANTAVLDANSAQRVVVSGLTGNTTYYFRCRGFRDENDKWGPFSAKSVAMLTKHGQRKRSGQSSDGTHPAKKTRVGAAKPGQPRPPICVRRTPTTITIAWSAPKDTGRMQLDSFQVQKRMFPENKTDSKVTNWVDIFSRHGFDGKMYEVTGLKPNTVLQFRVKGRNNLGWGKYSGASDPFTTLKDSSREFKAPSVPDDKYSIILDVDDIRYDEQKVRLGRGSFGVVYRSAVGGYRGTTVAVKVETQMYEESDTDADDQLKDWFREVKILACLRHPNLVLYMGACRAHGRRYIVTEYMGGGSLACALHTSAVPLTEKWRITSILTQVASAMAYLHSNNPEITHRDLKPANVLLDKTWTHAKVCDFGLARMHTQSIMSTLTKFAGTAPYMPPEALDEVDVTGKVDVYSFGIMTAETLLKEVPWKDMSSSAIVKAVCLQNRRPFELEKFEEPVGKLIFQCWDKDPLSRPSFDDILKILSKLGWAT